MPCSGFLAASRGHVPGPGVVTPLRPMAALRHSLRAGPNLPSWASNKPVVTVNAGNER
jgi:hypothetical protein